jgi:hypothetical protein
MESSASHIMDKIKTREHETPVDRSGQEMDSYNDPKQPNIQMNIKINSSYENDESMTHLN